MGKTFLRKKLFPKPLSKNLMGYIEGAVQFFVDLHSFVFADLFKIYLWGCSGSALFR